MPELFTNLAKSTLASGITAGALSITVQSGDGNDLFPSLGGSDNFRCVLFKKSTGDIEIINVTARSGDVFTITRAQEQIGNLTATAFAFDAGDLIELRPTSAYFTGLAAGASSANIQHGTFLYGVDTGAADAYVIAMNPTAITLDVGQEVRVQIGAGNTNTGIAATLKLDALTAHPITMEGGGNPPANSIRAGFVHTFNWDGVSFIFKSVGLALTSTGLNALGKQIKNVAAGTASTDAATLGGAETHTNKIYTSPTINTPTINTPTINGVPGRGSEFFAGSNIISLVSSTSSASVAWTTITNSTLTANNATIAWIQISLSGYIISATAIDSSYNVYLETSGLSGSVNIIAHGPQFSGKVRLKTAGSVNETTTAENTWLVPVVLDGSSQFQWGSNLSSTVYTEFKLSIDIVGYEV